MMYTRMMISDEIAKQFMKMMVEEKKKIKVK